MPNGMPVSRCLRTSSAHGISFGVVIMNEREIVRDALRFDTL
jgi:hypothetical protein